MTSVMYISYLAVRFTRAFMLLDRRGPETITSSEQRLGKGCVDG